MKYMGSKSRIAKYIVPILQKTIDDNNIEGYLDCFCGGCNIIDKIKCKHKIASDKNKYLIALLDYVKNDGELYKEVDKELYDKAQEIINAEVENIPREDIRSLTKANLEKMKKGERDFYL